MVSGKLKVLALLFLAMFLCAETNAQQVTREQLMKLFYKANTALNANDDAKAIDAFMDIVKKAPNLPEPYLQLGKLYAKDESNIESLKKSLISYKNYLQLNPDTEESGNIKSEIVRIEALIAGLEAPQNVEVAEVVEQPVDTVVPEKLVVTIDIPLEEPEVEVPEVVTDTVALLPVALPIPEDTVIIAEPIQAMLGRWTPLASTENGKDYVIFDVSAQGDSMLLSIDRNSYMIEKFDLSDALVKRFAGVDEIDGSVAFNVELKKNKWEDNRNAFDEMLDEIVAEDSIAVSQSIADSLIVEKKEVPYILYELKFNLKPDGNRLSGNLAVRITDSHDGSSTELPEQEFVFYRVQPDYSGFDIPQLSEEDKVMKLEFRDLFNRKIKESAKSVSALNDIGCMYMSGVGTRKNMKMAVAYFIEASMKNNLFAMLNLAELYFYGYGVDRNVEKARELYTKAFEMGYTDAMVLCGDTYMEGGVGILPDYEKAISCYQQALLKHSPFAVYRLGWVYNMDLEEIKDKDRALSYYDKAVSQKYPDALADYGIFYREGEMFPRDYQKSLEYLLRAADRGSARAMYELYTMYMCGYGVEQNYKLAKTWLTKYMANKNKPIWGYSTLKSEINSILGK